MKSKVRKLDARKPLPGYFCSFIYGIEQCKWTSCEWVDINGRIYLCGWLGNKNDELDRILGLEIYGKLQRHR